MLKNSNLINDQADSSPITKDLGGFGTGSIDASVERQACFNGNVSEISKKMSALDIQADLHQHTPDSRRNPDQRQLSDLSFGGSNTLHTVGTYRSNGGGQVDQGLAPDGGNLVKEQLSMAQSYSNTDKMNILDHVFKKPLKDFCEHRARFGNENIDTNLPQYEHEYEFYDRNHEKRRRKSDMRKTRQSHEDRVFESFV